MFSHLEWKRPSVSVFVLNCLRRRPLTRVLEVGPETLAVVVRVDEVVAGVVGRVDVDHLDLAQVRLLEKLQDLKVVAFDDQVLGGVPVDALVLRGKERAEARGLDRLEAVGLAGPGQAVALLARIDRRPARPLELVEIDLAVLRSGLREQAEQLPRLSAAMSSERRSSRSGLLGELAPLASLM